MATKLESKIEEAGTSVEWLDELKVWPQDVDPKAKDTDDFPEPHWAGFWHWLRCRLFGSGWVYDRSLWCPTCGRKVA